MKMTTIKKSAISLALLAITSTAHGQHNTPSSVSEQIDRTIQQTQESISHELATKAKAWGITEEEVSRYNELTSDGGIYSSLGKDLTVLEVLGMEARSDEERQRYARMMVEQESRYQKNVLAFEVAKMDELKKQYPHLDMWYSEEELRQRSLPELLKGLSSHLDKRLVIYVSADSCDSKCLDYVTKVRKSTSLSTRVDIFFTSTRGSDKKLREAVKNIGISSDEIDGVNLTVNHDQGYFAKMKVDGVKSLPMAVKIDSLSKDPQIVKDW